MKFKLNEALNTYRFVAVKWSDDTTYNGEVDAYSDKQANYLAHKYYPKCKIWDLHKITYNEDPKGDGKQLSMFENVQLNEEILKHKGITLDSDPSKFETISDPTLGLSYDYDGDPDDRWEYCNLCYNIYNEKGEYVGGVALYDDTIQGIVINNEYRKNNYGKLAVDALKKKFNTLIVHSTPQALNFWKHNGFKMDSREDYSGTYYGIWER